MNQVSQISVSESALLDSEQMVYLKKNLGTHGASDVICRAIDELSLTLARVENLSGSYDTRMIRKNCRAMKLAANLVGMRCLADVSDQALRAVDHADPEAMSVLLAKLVRVGQASLSALWEHPDLPF